MTTNEGDKRIGTGVTPSRPKHTTDPAKSRLDVIRFPMGSQSPPKPFLALGDVARHEAGHAVAALALGLEVNEVWIDESGAGAADILPGYSGTLDSGNQSLMEKYLIVALAGLAAEYGHLADRKRFYFDCDDIWRAYTVATELGFNREQALEHIRGEAYDAAIELIEDCYSELCDLVKALTAKWYLTKDEILEAVQ